MIDIAAGIEYIQEGAYKALELQEFRSYRAAIACLNIMVNGICTYVAGSVPLSTSVSLYCAIASFEVFTNPKFVPMFLPRLCSVDSFQFTWLLRFSFAVLANIIS